MQWLAVTHECYVFCLLKLAVKDLFCSKHPTLTLLMKADIDLTPVCITYMATSLIGHTKAVSDFHRLSCTWLQDAVSVCVALLAIRDSS